MRFSKKVYIAVILVAFVAAFVSVSFANSNSEKTLQARVIKKRSYLLVPAGLLKVAEKNDNINRTFRVEEIFIKQGERVSSGDRIVKLENKTLVKQLKVIDKDKKAIKENIEKLQESIDELKSRKEDLNIKETEIKNTIETAKENRDRTLDALSGNILKAETNLKETNKTISIVENKIKSDDLPAAEKEQLETRLDLLYKTKREIQKNLKKLKAEKEKLESEFKEKLEELNSTLTKVQDGKQEIKDTISEINRNEEILTLKLELIEERSAFLEILIDDMIIRANRDGWLKELYINEGEVVLPGIKIASIESNGFFIETYIPQKLLLSENKYFLETERGSISLIPKISGEISFLPEEYIYPVLEPVYGMKVYLYPEKTGDIEFKFRNKEPVDVYLKEETDEK